MAGGGKIPSDAGKSGRASEIVRTTTRHSKELIRKYRPRMLNANRNDVPLFCSVLRTMLARARMSEKKILRPLVRRGAVVIWQASTVILQSPKLKLVWLATMNAVKELRLQKPKNLQKMNAEISRLSSIKRNTKSLICNRGRRQAEVGKTCLEKKSRMNHRYR